MSEYLEVTRMQERLKLANAKLREAKHKLKHAERSLQEIQNAININET